jgi:hypothetical protein
LKVEVTGGWRKLHIEELCDLYSSPSIIRMIKLRMRWSGHVSRMEEKRNAYIGGRRLLGKPVCRWVGNTEMDL